MTNGSSQATVFVVDDDPSFRTAVSRLLRGAGHQVKVFASGSEFVLHAALAGGLPQRAVARVGARE
jgi:FixJ family two-component response regulator